MAVLTLQHPGRQPVPPGVLGDAGVAPHALVAALDELATRQPAGVAGLIRAIDHDLIVAIEVSRLLGALAVKRAGDVLSAESELAQRCAASLSLAGRTASGFVVISEDGLHEAPNSE